MEVGFRLVAVFHCIAVLTVELAVRPLGQRPIVQGSLAFGTLEAFLGEIQSRKCGDIFIIIN